MFTNCYPFGSANNCGPLGCTPYNCLPYNGISGYNSLNCIGGVCSPVSAWNPGFSAGFNSPFFAGSYNGFGYNWNTPSYGLHNWNLNTVPFANYGINQWNGLGHINHLAHPMFSQVPFSGTQLGQGFPGMNWISGSIGCNTPWTNSYNCFPGNYSNLYGVSPVAGVSNWFSSPWMGYAYPVTGQQQGVVNNIKTPVNGQYIPANAYPFNCAPFSAPYGVNSYAPVNGFVPAGHAVNCEAA
ncbi:MAG: hypothetical protein H6813_02335 [Phycisphaeraceae bacterium]|nr:hypothetical protein [Phycisphaeraceae bacterium]MCB9848844.1 hypothetical protein [Phycisphaeraceae bacterium]